MYMLKQDNYKYPKIKTLSASKLRENLFTSLDSVYSTNETLVIEKSGIPIAYIISPEDYKSLEIPDIHAAEELEFFKLLEETQGLWSDIPDFDKNLKERESIEQKAAKRRTKKW